jgi:hypothetical protein
MAVISHPSGFECGFGINKAPPAAADESKIDLGWSFGFFGLGADHGKCRRRGSTAKEGSAWYRVHDV